MPAVLESWEVERVIQLLESADPLIRRTVSIRDNICTMILVLNTHKTLKLLNRIDSNIVASYYSQALQTIPSTLSVIGKNAHAVWMLELLETKSGEDGELYAQELINLLVLLESVPPAGAPVVEPAVERVLLCLHNGMFICQPLSLN